MLLMSRAYKNKDTDALQTLTGLIPLDIQLSAEAEFSGVIRHGISTEEWFSPLFHNKASKNLLPPPWTGIQVSKFDDYNGNIKIFTDGSKCNTGTGSAFCVCENDNLIFSWQAHLAPKKSVFQAELLATKSAVEWLGHSSETIFVFISDSLLGILALQNLEHTDPLVKEIQRVFTHF